MITLVALALALAAVAVFWGARDNEFVWDDPIVFQQQLPYFDSFSNVFFPPKGIPQFGQNYYRPLIIVTYQLDEKVAAAFWPLEKREDARRLVYHHTPLLWHAAATVLVFLLGVVLTRVAGRPGPPGLDGLAGLAGSAAAALLFAVHPIHTESVAWMAGRSDVVCAVFFLAAVLFYLLHRATVKLGWLFAAAAMALLAMLAKETGVGLLLLVPVIDLMTRAGEGLGGEEPARSRAERRLEQRAAAKGGRGSRGGKGEAPQAVAGPGVLLRWGVFAAAGAFYLIVRNSALAGSGSPFKGNGAGGPEALPAALGWYIQKLLWPPPQSAFVAEMPGSTAILAGLAAGAVSLYLLWLWSRKPGWGREGIALGLFYAALAPSMAIALFSISETPLAERYLYIPSAGGLLLFAFLAERAAARLLPAGKPALQQGLVAGAALMIALPAAAATAKRAEVWQSDLAFWQDAVVKSPKQGIPHLHLGIAYATQGKTEAAVEEYKLALQYYDDREGRAKAHNNLGSAYLRLARYREAIEHFKGALEQDPDYATPYYNWALASLYLAQQARRDGQLEDAQRSYGEAIAQLQRAIQINPRYPKAHLRLGMELISMGRTEEGRSHLQQVVQMAPASAEGIEARRVLSGEKGK
jgi:tetratricopeptide (TPR) repeat protein